MTATRTDITTNCSRLYVALELGSSWKVGSTIGRSQRARIKTIPAGDTFQLQEEIKQAKARFHLPPDCPVVCCYEIGRDGFWLHRYLVEHGIDNIVVDPASIEVNRRKRRAKTDRLDAESLLKLLIRFHDQEQGVLRAVRVPSPEVEDQRQIERELLTLKKEQTQHRNRIRSLLVTVGIYTFELKSSFLRDIKQLRDYRGDQLTRELRDRLQREFTRLRVVVRQIRALEKRRAGLIKHGTGRAAEQTRRLMSLQGIGATSAWLWVTELFSWRELKNRRQVGAIMGLTPTPYSSGSGEREQGISKSGNRRARAMSIEISWMWLAYQPESELTQWFEKRFAHGSSRMRRIGIVAVARKLIIQLWRYLETGEIPPGAKLKEGPQTFQYTTTLG